MARNAAPVARWSAASPLIAARSASDDRISSGWNSRSASVDLPEPAAPTSTTTDGSGIAITRHGPMMHVRMHVRMADRCERWAWTPGPPSSGSAVTSGCTTTRPCLRHAPRISAWSRCSCSTRSCSTGVPRRRTAHGSSSRRCGRCATTFASSAATWWSVPATPGSSSRNSPGRSARPTSTCRVTTPRMVGHGTWSWSLRSRRWGSPGTRSPGCSSTSRRSSAPSPAGRSACSRHSVGPGRRSSRVPSGHHRATCRHCRRVSRPVTCRLPPRRPRIRPACRPRVKRPRAAG